MNLPAQMAGQQDDGPQTVEQLVTQGYFSVPDSDPETAIIHLDKVLELFADVVRRPAFAEDKIDLAKVQERMLRVKDSMEIEGPGGERLAMVKKALITPLRDRWVVKIGDGPDLDVKGNILDHEYHIGEGRDKVAEVSKKWFRIRDSYGVAIDPGQNDVLILAITVAIDMMAHPGR